MRYPAGIYNINYAQDMNIIRTKAHWVIFVLGMIALFTFPLYATSFIHIINLVGIYVISAVGLMLLTGYCGQISLGQAAFMMVGAYTGAWMTRAGFPFFGTLILSGLITGVVGLIFGLPAVRVKGFYLAMSTLAAQFIIPWCIVEIRPDFTGGIHSLRVNPISIFGHKLISQIEIFYVIIPITCILVIFAKNLVRTQIGRAWVAIRDNDLAAEVLGINIFFYKVLAFFVCTFFAGISGCLWAHWMRNVGPTHFELVTSIWFLGMIILGGMGSITGAVVGVIVVRILDYVVSILLTPVVEEAFPLLSNQIVAGLPAFVFGLIILLFVIFEPRGVNHRWEIFKASYRIWPFSY
jgi:branched-chain amino acid transport system permease protein